MLREVLWIASHANVLRGSSRVPDEPVRTSAWEAMLWTDWKTFCHLKPRNRFIAHLCCRILTIVTKSGTTAEKETLLKSRKSTKGLWGTSSKIKIHLIKISWKELDSHHWKLEESKTCYWQYTIVYHMTLELKQAPMKWTTKFDCLSFDWNRDL